jgi:flavin-dependent dehydrogenase
VRRTAALIAGGGPAGSAAAITLGRAGLRPLIIERDAIVGDAICGGFVSWRTCATLSGLGIDPAGFGGTPIERLRMFAARRSAEAPLPARALGLSRRALDTRLIEAAARAGAGIERGVAIAAFEEEEGRPSLRLRDGARLSADQLILATGKHDLRGIARPRPAAGEDRMVGLRVHLAPGGALRTALRGTIELHLFRGGYAGLLLQEDGVANLCMAVRGSRLADAGSPTRLFEELARESPPLGDRIGAGSVSVIDAIAQVPYGWRAQEGTRGVFRTGDQAGVISSLAGEGIGIALATGIAAARAVARDDSAPLFQQRIARRLVRPLACADAVRAAAEGPILAGMMVGLLDRAPRLARIVARLTRVSAVDAA